MYLLLLWKFIFCFLLRMYLNGNLIYLRLLQSQFSKLFLFKNLELFFKNHKFFTNSNLDQFSFMPLWQMFQETKPVISLYVYLLPP